MRCTHCEKCCHETEMELCEADVTRLERAGFRRDEFSHLCADGVRRLRNNGGYCFFYDHSEKRCTVYSRRPLGCVIYPVNMSSDGEIVVDDLCPEAHTITLDEMNTNGGRLRRLLETIASESRGRQ